MTTPPDHDMEEYDGAPICSSHKRCLEWQSQVADLRAENDRLRAENERLRGFVKRFRNLMNREDTPVWHHGMDAMEALDGDAKSLLKGSDG